MQAACHAARTPTGSTGTVVGAFASGLVGLSSGSEASFLVKGLPNLRDRFVQYGIRMSFWGSGTLKIVIYVKNYPQRNEMFSFG